MSFFLPWKNWEKSHRFVCRFFCRPKTGKKVIGLYEQNENNLAHKDEIAFLFTSAEKNDMGDNQCKICT